MNLGAFYKWRQDQMDEFWCYLLVNGELLEVGRGKVGLKKENKLEGNITL